MAKNDSKRVLVNSPKYWLVTGSRSFRRLFFNSKYLSKYEMSKYEGVF